MLRDYVRTATAPPVNCLCDKCLLGYDAGFRHTAEEVTWPLSEFYEFRCHVLLSQLELPGQWELLVGRTIANV